MSGEEKMERKEAELELLKKKKRSHRRRNHDERDLQEIVGELGPNTYRVLALLGVGSQGRVYLVQLKDTEELFAMKVFRKDKIICNTKTTRSILTEHRFLATANHPFITTLYNSFQSPERLFMIMEYCPGGELFTTIKKQPGGRLTEEQVRFYASEVVLVLEYIHSKGYIYRDLKPENILLHLDGHIRMADFGLSKQGERPSVALVARREKRKSIFVKQKTTVELCTGEVLRTNSLVGSVHYLAPEVLVSAANEGYDAMADWWAFGVLLYDMLYGFPPFQGRTNEDVIMKIVSCEYTFPSDIPASHDIKSLIKGLLKLDAKKRLCSKHGANDVKKHPFFEGEHWGLLRNRAPPIIPKIISPDDTSNFIIYEEDEDSVDFEFFSELDEDATIIASEDQAKFEEFTFASEEFQGMLKKHKSQLLPRKKRHHRRRHKKSSRSSRSKDADSKSSEPAKEETPTEDDEEVNDEEVNDEEVNDEEVNDEEVNDEEVNDEEDRDDEKEPVSGDEVPSAEASEGGEEEDEEPSAAASNEEAASAEEEDRDEPEKETSAEDKEPQAAEEDGSKDVEEGEEDDEYDEEEDGDDGDEFRDNVGKDANEEKEKDSELSAVPSSDKTKGARTPGFQQKRAKRNLARKT